jgi:hypothetical protein
MNDAAEIITDTTRAIGGAPAACSLVVESAGGGPVGTSSISHPAWAGVVAVSRHVLTDEEFVQRIRNIKQPPSPVEMGYAGIRAITDAIAARLAEVVRSIRCRSRAQPKAGGLLRLALLGLDTPCVYTPHAFVTLNPDLAPSEGGFDSIERLLSARSSAIICVF